MESFSRKKHFNSSIVVQQQLTQYRLLFNPSVCGWVQNVTVFICCDLMESTIHDSECILNDLNSIEKKFCKKLPFNWMIFEWFIQRKFHSERFFWNTWNLSNYSQKVHKMQFFSKWRFATEKENQNHHVKNRM